MAITRTGNCIFYGASADEVAGSIRASALTISNPGAVTGATLATFGAGATYGVIQIPTGSIHITFGTGLSAHHFPSGLRITGTGITAVVWL